MRRVPVLICVAAVLMLATVGPASAAGGWTVQYPPNPAGSFNSSLEGVSCAHVAAVPASCIAVGGYQSYTIGLFAPHVGDVIRVWIYAPAAAGFVAIDDATLSVDLGPR